MSTFATENGIHVVNIDSRPLTHRSGTHIANRLRIQPPIGDTYPLIHLSRLIHVTSAWNIYDALTQRAGVHVQALVGEREQPLRLAKRAKGSLSSWVANSGRSDITNTCSNASLHNPQQAIEAHTTAMETIRVFLHTCTCLPFSYSPLLHPSSTFSLIIVSPLCWFLRIRTNSERVQP